MGRWRLWFLARRNRAIPISDLIPRVLIVMTVETKQLPVAAVGWIVVVVVVFMMDRELPQFFATKFATRTVHISSDTV